MNQQIMSFEGWALQMYSTQDSSGLNAGIHRFTIGCKIKIE